MLSSFRSGRVAAWTNIVFWALMLVGDLIKSTNFVLAIANENSAAYADGDYPFAPGIPTKVLAALTLFVVALELAAVTLGIVANLIGA